MNERNSNAAVTSLRTVAPFLANQPTGLAHWLGALALSRLGDPCVFDGLEQALSLEEDPQVRQHIEDGMARLRQS